MSILSSAIHNELAKITPLIDRKAIVAMVESDLEAIIADEREANPKASTAQLAAAVLNDAKHYLRGKVGLVIDLLWGLVETDVKTAVENALEPTVEAHVAGGSTLS